MPLGRGYFGLITLPAHNTGFLSARGQEINYTPCAGAAPETPSRPADFRAGAARGHRPGRAASAASLPHRVTAPPTRGGSGGAGGDALRILPGLPRDPSSLRHRRPPSRSPRAAGEAGAGGGACSAGQAEGKGRPQPGASRRAAGPSSAEPPSAGGSAVTPEPSAGGSAVNPDREPGDPP